MRAWAQALAAGALFFTPNLALGQATFFQVPSGEVSDPGGICVQQQSTLSDRLDLTLQANVGIGWNVDVGASVYNFDLARRAGAIVVDANSTDRDEPFGPLALAVVDKRFEVGKSLALSFGAQFGPNLARSEDVRVAVRSYGMVALAFGEDRKCAAGGYVANGIFVGGAPVQGAPWAGCDIALVEELIELQADWDFGAHANGAATIGPQFRMTHHVGIAPAVRIPNPWSEALWAAVLQFELKTF